MIHARRQGKAVPSAGRITHVSAKISLSSAPLGDADQVAWGVRASHAQPPSKRIGRSAARFFCAVVSRECVCGAMRVPCEYQRRSGGGDYPCAGRGATAHGCAALNLMKETLTVRDPHTLYTR